MTLELWAKILKYVPNKVRANETDKAIFYTNLIIDTDPLLRERSVSNVSFTEIEIGDNKYYCYTIKRTENGRTEENTDFNFKCVVETFLQPFYYNATLVATEPASDSESEPESEPESN